MGKVVFLLNKLSCLCIYNFMSITEVWHINNNGIVRLRTKGNGMAAIPKNYGITINNDIKIDKKFC